MDWFYYYTMDDITQRLLIIAKQADAYNTKLDVQAMITVVEETIFLVKYYAASQIIVNVSGTNHSTNHQQANIVNNSLYAILSFYSTSKNTPDKEDFLSAPRTVCWTATHLQTLESLLGKLESLTTARLDEIYKMLHDLKTCITGYGAILSDVAESISTFVIPPMSDSYVLPLVDQYSLSLDEISKVLQEYTTNIHHGNRSALHLADQIILTCSDIELVIDKISSEITFPIRRTMEQNMREILSAYNRSQVYLLDLSEYYPPVLSYAMPKLVWERPLPVFNGTWVSYNIR